MGASIAHHVDRRAANIRAGYVYIISNVGSFGENMVKIGMTRRLDPRDRVGEGDGHGRAGGHTARMTSAGLAPDPSASALMSSGSDVQMTAPVAAAITTTVASTTSEVPARPQRIPAALEVSSPT